MIRFFIKKLKNFLVYVRIVKDLINFKRVAYKGKKMKTFCFTVDDNIRFFKEIMENDYKSIFDHPYLAVYKRLHLKFNLKVQLNLFYEMQDFNLSLFSDKYKTEWQNNSDWLKLSFHSKRENVKPYEFSDYSEVYEDCKAVNSEIERFAGLSSLAKTTTIHYCLTTQEGLKALTDNNVRGLLGLFGSQQTPRTSYNIDEEDASKIRNGGIVKIGNTHFSGIDIVLNNFSTQDIIKQLTDLIARNNIKVMIHEQYFYKDYIRYQPDFEEKLYQTFEFLINNNYKSSFLEEVIE